MILWSAAYAAGGPCAGGSRDHVAGDLVFWRKRCQSDPNQL